MALRKGYAGTILRVNLSNGNITREDLNQEYAVQYIGGRGLGMKYLYEEVPAGVDPLGEHNKLLFMTGPLAGTPSQSSSRWMVVTKSPLTGTVMRATGGAHFGQEFKAAGIDLVVIEGKAEQPCTLVIRDEDAELQSAKHLWGQEVDTATLQERLRDELGDENMRMACIGPAGEKGSLIAAIMSERRSASRGGVGAVMGSKNLKAIAVRGTRKVSVANHEGLNAVAKQIVSDARKTELFDNFSHLGTPGVTTLFHELGLHPVKNFQRGQMVGFSSFNPEKLDEAFVKDEGCARCFIRCGSYYQVKTGPYKGDPVVAPEYETLWSFGANIENTDLSFIVEANKVCDDEGIDTISAGSIIAFAMELYQRGILTQDDLEGIDLQWGNCEAAHALLLKIAKREGFGELLSLGVKRAAETIGKGAEQYAMHVKGLELPAYEPRGAKAHGLNLATGNIGASHMTGYSSPEIFGIPESVDRFAVEGKGELIRKIQDNAAVDDSIIMCGFPAGFLWVDSAVYAQLLFSATGVKEFSDVEYLQKAGERIYNLERQFNVDEGFRRENDYLPKRFVEEELDDGPSQGQVVEMDQLLDDYYTARGWEVKIGVPGSAKLKALDIQVRSKKV